MMLTSASVRIEFSAGQMHRLWRLLLDLNGEYERCQGVVGAHPPVEHRLDGLLDEVEHAATTAADCGIQVVVLELDREAAGELFHALDACQDQQWAVHDLWRIVNDARVAQDPPVEAVA